MSDADDSHEIVISFLSSLPQTIRPETLLFVVIYALDTDLDDEGDFAGQLARDLRSRGGMRLFGSTLRTIAALDFVLAREK